MIMFFFLASCADSDVVTKYESGKVKEVFKTKENGTIKNGPYKKLTETGEIMEKARYEEDKLVGERIIFFKNGNPEIKEFYKDGVLDGEYNVFREDGSLLLKSNYANGTLQGISTKYFPDGNISEEVTFVDGEENGPFKEYYENGQVQWEGIYKNGDNEFGLLKQFDKEGTLIKKMMCNDMAICQTIWTFEKGDIEIKEINVSQ